MVEGEGGDIGQVLQDICGKYLLSITTKYW